MKVAVAVARLLVWVAGVVLGLLVMPEGMHWTLGALVVLGAVFVVDLIGAALILLAAFVLEARRW